MSIVALILIIITLPLLMVVFNLIYFWWIGMVLEMILLIFFVYSILSSNSLYSNYKKHKEDILRARDILTFDKKNNFSNIVYINKLLNIVQKTSFIFKLFFSKNIAWKVIKDLDKDLKLNVKKISIMSFDKKIKKQNINSIIYKKKKKINIIELDKLTSAFMVRDIERKDPKEPWKKKKFESPCDTDFARMSNYFYKYNLISIFGNVSNDVLSIYKERWICSKNYYEALEKFKKEGPLLFRDPLFTEEEWSTIYRNNENNVCKLVPREINTLLRKLEYVEKQIFDFYHETQYGFYLDKFYTEDTYITEVVRLNNMRVREENMDVLLNNKSTKNYLWRLSNKVDYNYAQMAMCEKKKYYYRSLNIKEDDYVSVLDSINLNKEKLFN